VQPEQKIAGDSMAVKLQIIHANDFIKATPEGEVNLELSKTRIRKLAGSLDLKHEYSFLVDWRNVTVNFSMTDMFYMALEVARHKELSRAKISLLVPVNSFDRGEFLQLCAQNRGVQLAAFTEYEEATNWLSTATELKL
jgi:hypothetical protein